MTDAHRFAVDVLRIISDRFQEQAADLGRMAASGAAFDGWLNGEAFLACKLQQSGYPFCDVTLKPPYGGENGEGVMDANGNPCLKRGDLRVGATDEKGDHRWVFAEFVLLHGGDRDGDDWPQRIEQVVSRLKRLGWVNSISLLILVLVSQSEVLKEWGERLQRSGIWSRPALTQPFTLSLPGGGTLVVKAFDVKQDEANVRSALSD